LLTAVVLEGRGSNQSPQQGIPLAAVFLACAVNSEKNCIGHIQICVESRCYIYIHTYVHKGIVVVRKWVEAMQVSWITEKFNLPNRE
jgi:hypothetical protein